MKRRTSSPYRLDHERVIQEEDDSLLCIIPLSARNMVLSMFEWLDWDAMWSVNPPSPEERDNIDHIVQEAKQAMSTAISVQLLDGRLTEIKEAIESIEPGGGGGGDDCCDALIDVLGQLVLAEVVDDIPAAEAGDNPHLNEGDLSTATASEGDVCGYVEAVALGMASTLRGLAGVVSLGWLGVAIAGVIMLAAAWPFTLVSAGFALAGAGALATLWGAMLSYTGPQMLAQADLIESSLEEYKCAALDVRDSINTAGDIYAIMNVLRDMYPPAAAGLAFWLYTTGLAEKHAGGEWAAADCPECVEGCGGLSWSFKEPYPECWIRPGTSIVGPLGVQDTAPFTSARTQESLPLPHLGSTILSPQRVRVTWRPITGGSNCRLRISAWRRTAGSGGGWTNVADSGSIAGITNGVDQINHSPNFTPIDGQEYRVTLTWTSWTSTAQTSIHRYARVIPA